MSSNTDYSIIGFRTQATNTSTTIRTMLISLTNRWPTRWHPQHWHIE